MTIAPSSPSNAALKRELKGRRGPQAHDGTAAGRAARDFPAADFRRADRHAAHARGAEPEIAAALNTVRGAVGLGPQGAGRRRVCRTRGRHDEGGRQRGDGGARAAAEHRDSRLSLARREDGARDAAEGRQRRGTDARADARQAGRARFALGRCRLLAGDREERQRVFAVLPARRARPQARPATSCRPTPTSRSISRSSAARS